MAKHGKKYVEAAKLVDPRKAYSPLEALALARKTSTTKFDATVETHWRLGVNPKHADQQVRGVATLPNGTGRPVRVLVFAQGEGARIAEEAGADFVGSDEIVKRIEEGWVDFDVAIATPDMMGKVGKLGKVLGRRGLMPNPKSGTIAQAPDLPRLIKEAKMGRVEFKVDKSSNLHVPIGKVSFTEQQLLENLASLVEAVIKAKPSGARGQYVQNIVLTTTMGPGIKLDLQPTLSLTVA
ncbi:MAG: 50S ribosomal protein L1 [Chloroflexi bacterium]|nr:50S ribosomal protein L1 [Chloroflexota bacterium]MBI5955508.1 50S ribosomal protein L1 [Chloroflexota bacterium]